MDSTRHTDAAAMEAFMAKPQSAQLLEIWLNGRETNGAVADAQLAISSQGLEIQKARMDLSMHIESHVTAEEIRLLRAAGSIPQLLEERKTMIARVGIMWSAFQTGKRILIIGGGILGFLLAIQPLELWLLTKYWG